jgi:hypothetical protein
LSNAFVPLRERARDLARYGENLATLLEREVGRDEGSTPFAGFDDDRRTAEAGDDPGFAPETPRAGSTPGSYSDTTSPFSPILRASSACAAG